MFERKKIAHGWGNWIAVGNDGYVYVWGEHAGTAGDGTTQLKVIQTPLKVPNLSNITCVHINTNDAFAVDIQGRLWTWGETAGPTPVEYGPTDAAYPVDTIIGSTHNGNTGGGLINNSNRLSIWGENTEGKFGVGDYNIDQVMTPYYSRYSTKKAIIGDYHSIALDTWGTVHCAGRNTGKQVKDSSDSEIHSWYQVPGLSNIIDVALQSWGGSIALKSDGTVWIWGSDQCNIDGDTAANSFYKIGTPTQVTELSNIQAITATREICYALDNNGEVWLWGKTGAVNSIVPVTKMSCLGNNNVFISAGITGLTVVKSNGEIWTSHIDTTDFPADLSSVAAQVVGDPVYNYSFRKMNLNFALDSASFYVTIEPDTESGRIYDTPISIGLTCSDPTATIRYTIDGSIPTDTSPILSGAINITSNTTIKARAFKNGEMSPVFSWDYYIRCGAPSINPTGGSIWSSQNVTISVPQGCTVRYTTDGSAPSRTNGTAITANKTITISSTQTVKAMAYRNGYADSNISSETYTMKTVSTPSVTSGGTFYNSKDVTMYCSTSGATIYYTTDGTDPKTSGTRRTYTGKITITSSCTVKAIATYGSGWSSVTTRTYTIIPWVSVTGISLSEANKELTVDATFTLTATVSPSNATDSTFNWASNNTNVATVDSNGLVTAIAPGTCTIKVTTHDGGFTDTCAIIVSNCVPIVDINLDLTSGNWVQYEQYPDGTDGIWSYDPATGYITNSENQSGISGFYNTDHLGYADYEITLHYNTQSTDDDGIGAIFRFQNENNYYVFMSDDAGLGYTNGARLQRRKNGGLKTIGEVLIPNASWVRYSDNILKIAVVKDHIVITLNDNIIYDFIDDDPILTGAFGPVTSSQPDTTFTSFEALIADAPPAPTFGSADVVLQGLDATFSWSPVIDPATVNNAEASYIVRIGTTPGGQDVLGATQVPAGTNSHQTTLPGVGVYYFSVQAYSSCSNLTSAQVIVTKSTMAPISTSPFTKAGIDTLRQRTNELRDMYNLSDYGWTDSVITRYTTPIKAQHLTELADAITDVYTAKGLSVSWTSINQGARKDNAHWSEIQTKLNDLLVL